MTSTVADFSAPFAPHHFDCDTMQSRLDDAQADQEAEHLQAPRAGSRSRGTSEEPEAARSVLLCVAGGDAAHQLVDPVTLSCGHSLCKVCRADRRSR